ncbi:MAG: S-layer homology domain-containing protein, partial [Ruminococcus callidus]|nr:S-layer homology domain-containing protein [Ruminococcus callidus]
ISLIAGAVNAKNANVTEKPYYNVYTSIGDSVGSGFSLDSTLVDGTAYINSCYPHLNYYQSPAESYPQVANEALGAKLYNMGMVSFQAADYVNTLLKPDYVAWMFSWYENIFGIPAEDCAYHYLMVDTIKQADLISINMGSNDLLQGLMLELSALGYGDDFYYDSETHTYKNLNNAAAYVVWKALFSLLSGQSMDAVMKTLQSDIEKYRDQITMEDVVELMQFLSSDNIDAVLKKHAKLAMAEYEKVVQLIAEGMEITQEQYDALMAGYAAADEKLATASTEAAEGQISQKDLLTDGRLEVTKKADGSYFVEPINADAQLAFIGCYNPFGNSLFMSDEEKAEFDAACAEMLRLIFKILFPNMPFSDGNMPQEDLTAASEDEILAGNEQYEETLKAVEQTLMEHPELAGTPFTAAGQSNAVTAREDTGTDALMEQLMKLLDEYSYPLMYLLMGKPSQGALDYMNSEVKTIADGLDAPYIDIMQIPNEDNINPHPEAAGHAYIAEQITNTLLPVVTVSAGEGGRLSYQGEVAVKYDSDLTIEIQSDTGYAPSAVSVDGKPVELQSNKTFTLKNVRSAHTVQIDFAKAEKPVFSDIEAGAYYEDAVYWAVENGITNGYEDGTFRPYNSCTRAEMVTFLWRAAGSPEPTIQNTQFTDVQKGKYYYDAVLWAVENEITNGTSETTFSPDDQVIRGQAVTFLWRMEGSPKATSAKNTFSDVEAGTYYYDAVLWAVENEITNGTSATTFSPKDDCTRGQIVTFLYRCLAE